MDLNSGLLDGLTRRSAGLPGASGVRYIYVTGSTNHHGCPCCEGAWYTWNNLLTLTLLDGDLAPVPDAHFAVNLERLHLNTFDPCLFLDYQVFVARTTVTNPKKDQLFVLVDGFVASIMSLAARRVAAPPWEKGG